ncbi:unnamed protein product [Dovyalis caffra]|uniref:GPI inositol-deacylase PGAP1-like alpha/beta domain-containing protein n=1 Tax=Dovyalis caffra TaxID=77055 RepID=A0AAV1R2N3_9ROSI|nr:unnamed protein product [Dovyalis caffra]
MIVNELYLLAYVRSKLESLDGIVPPSNGFLISSTGMKNVWLSMEHQAILWCNQLVVQVSHTLLSLIDSKTGQPFPEANKRLAVFASMLRSGIPQSFNWMSSHRSTYIAFKDVKDAAGSQVHTLSSCPNNVHWNDDGFDRDLYIQATTMTVLAMDGRRRWLDILKLGSDGKGHFMFVTNLAPCFGVRLHLWPEKGKSASEMAASKRVLEVTAKLVQIPSGPAPRQIEPGSQTEQAPPSAVLWLSPEDMRGFRFLTVSVAPRPTISGRPPPAASMAVGQFFNPDDGKRELSTQFMLLSTRSQKELLLKEDHPLALNLSFTVSLGLLPISLSLTTTGCGIQRSGLLAEEVEDMDNSRLCKLRCFPPVALAWDPTSGLHIFPNLFSETIMVDPHCSYKASIAVSETAAASRFLLLYSSQVILEPPPIVGFSIAIIFFALMRQAHAWDLDLPIPSMLVAVVRVLRVNQLLVAALTGIILGCFVHPALDDGNERSQQFASKHDAGLNQNFLPEENSSSSPDSSRSFGDTQLEIFHHRHGLLILHLLATLMFVPSFVAWLQRIGMGHSFPWFLDSVLCIGIILHGNFNPKPEFNSLFLFPKIFGKEVRLDFIYLLAGYYSYLAGLGLVPYRVFYAMATIGFISWEKSYALQVEEIGSVPLDSDSAEKNDMIDCAKHGDPPRVYLLEIWSLPFYL